MGMTSTDALLMQAHRRKPARAGLRNHPHRWARRWDGWCRRAEARLAGYALAVDLRVDVASRAWFGGVARLLGCALPVVLVWPTLTPLEAAPLPLPDGGEAAELRAQAISPLGAGGLTGRPVRPTNAMVRLASVPERATIGLTAVLGENDSVAHMLHRLGLGTADADAVRTLVAPLTAETPLPAGTRFAVTLGARAAPGAPRPLTALAFRARFDLDVTITRTGGGLALARHALPVDATPLHLVGAVGQSLYRAARDAGAAPDTVQAYLQAIDQYVPFEAIMPGDQFDLVVAHKRAQGSSGAAEGHDGDLLYAGVIRDGKPLVQAMRWGTEGNFFTPDALAEQGGQSAGLLAAPVAGNITSWFGMRNHPILGYMRMHSGIDFAASYGAPIFAASDGVVSYAGWHGGHGNYVRLAHGGGIDTGYGHMSQIAVAPGSRVARGQVIGYVGSTGLSTGPHLHYELYRGGQPVDPLSIRFVPHHSTVSPAEVASFKARLQQLRALPVAGGAMRAG